MRDFFDFEAFVAPTVIKVWFVLLVFVWLLAAAVLIIFGAVTARWNLVVFGVVSPLAVLGFRLVFESAIVVFSIRETLADIREELVYATSRYAPPLDDVDAGEPSGPDAAG
jgi:hypothetical protein